MRFVPTALAKYAFSIPGQEISGEGHAEHQCQQNAAREPQQFPAALIGTIENGLPDVQG